MKKWVLVLIFNFKRQRDDHKRRMTNPTITENFFIYRLEIFTVRTQPWKRPAVLCERLLPRLQADFLP